MEDIPNRSNHTDRNDIIEVCRSIKEMLLTKNAAYGSSFSNPVRCFSRAPAREALQVRMDDKLSRLMRGDPSADDEDTRLDLIGYLILDRVLELREKRKRLNEKLKTNPPVTILDIQ